jgi:hypothetical protein
MGGPQSVPRPGKRSMFGRLVIQVALRYYVDKGFAESVIVLDLSDLGLVQLPQSLGLKARKELVDLGCGPVKTADGLGVTEATFDDMLENLVQGGMTWLIL